MADRHGYGPRYSRPRSPTLYNPARSSLPANVGYGGYSVSYGDPMYSSSRRDVIMQPRSSGDRLVAKGPITTTTYKVKPPSPAPSGTRTGSRIRSATVDSSGRSFAVPRLRPVIHTTIERPVSPVSSSSYRTSDESTYLVPATSHHRHRRNSYKIDTGAGYRGKSRDADHLRVGGGREGAIYTGSRGRSLHSGALVTASDDYKETGYTLTNPGGLAQYDLGHSVHRHGQQRRGSADARSRPPSAFGMADLGAKSFDSRERGPPPSTRGRDFLATRSTIDVPPRPRGEKAYESESRSSRKPRPVSMYQEREQPRNHRDGTYSSRESEARERPARESEVRERAPRENSHPSGRYDNDDDKNTERVREKHGHERRNSLAATLGLAAAGALGLTAASQGKDQNRDERDEPSRRPREDSDEERRRGRRADERESASVESDNRTTREKSYAREGRRDSPPHERDPLPSREHERESTKARHGSTSSQSPSREKRGSPSLDDGRARRDSTAVVDRPQEEIPMARTLSHSGSTSASDVSPNEKDRRSTRVEPPASDHSSSEKDKRSSRAEPTTPTAAFNPKDTSDLRALKAQLSRQEDSKDARRPSTAGIAGDGAMPSSFTRDRNYESREDDRGRRDLSLIDETQPPSQLRDPPHQIRVVSPPREPQVAKTEEKPVKGILRAPREKFPEDPEHIREGVAPLKDSKKDGVPPDARWTQISRALVNPEALELGKERYEERDDRVIVLRVLSKAEIEQYAIVTEAIRAEREEKEKEHQRRRRAQRRERHERHKKESADHRRSSRRGKEDNSESDTTEDDDRDNDHVRAIEAPDLSRPKKITFDDNTLMSGGLGGGLGDLRENPSMPGTFSGYVRNPPALQPHPR